MFYLSASCLLFSWSARANQGVVMHRSDVRNELHKPQKKMPTLDLNPAKTLSLVELSCSEGSSIIPPLISSKVSASSVSGRSSILGRPGL